MQSEILNIVNLSFFIRQIRMMFVCSIGLFFRLCNWLSPLCWTCICPFNIHISKILEILKQRKRNFYFLEKFSSCCDLLGHWAMCRQFNAFATVWVLRLILFIFYASCNSVFPRYLSKTST